jgi:hypothetical protein
MKVFISWSGERSKKVAEALREWLPNVIQSLDPWMSSEDIEKGARWYVDIVSELESSYYGIICLTSDNIESPWIHFEAGALSKSMEKSRVCPYLFHIDPSIIKAPLVLFQAAKSTKEDTKKLLHSINQALAENALSAEKLDKTFERWWPDLNAKLEEISKMKDKPIPKRSEIEMLEEILEIVRSLSRSVASDKDDFKWPLESPEFVKRIRNVSECYQKLPEEIKDEIRKKGARD